MQEVLEAADALTEVLKMLYRRYEFVSNMLPIEMWPQNAESFGEGNPGATESR